MYPARYRSGIPITTPTYSCSTWGWIFFTVKLVIDPTEEILCRDRGVWMKWRVHFAWSKRGEQVGIFSPRLHIRSIWRSGPSSFFPPSIGLDHRQTSIHKHAKTKLVTRSDREKELEGFLFPYNTRATQGIFRCLLNHGRSLHFFSGHCTRYRIFQRYW